MRRIGRRTSLQAITVALASILAFFAARGQREALAIQRTPWAFSQLPQNERHYRRKQKRRGNRRNAPATIIKPAKLKYKNRQARAKDVMQVWKTEIPKPDFAIRHAAKAVRLLLDVNLTGVESLDDGRGDPVLNALVDRTMDLLVAGNFSVISGQPSDRQNPGDLASQDLVGMIRSIAVVRDHVPRLTKEVLPLLVARTPEAIPLLSAEEVLNLMVPACDLHGTAPELWRLSLSHVNASMAKAVATADLSKVVRALCSMPEVTVEAKLQASDGSDLPDDDSTLSDEASGQWSAGKAVELLRALEEEVVARFDKLGIEHTGDLAWDFVRAGIAGSGLRQLVLNRAKEADSWKRDLLEPTLFRILCVFALLRHRDEQLLKTIARLTLREDLPTLTNWAVAVMAWSFSELEESQDGLADFRSHLSRELGLRGLTAEQVALSPLGPEANGDEELAELWRHRRDVSKKFFIAPRPVNLLRRLSKEADARLASATRQLEMNSKGEEELEETDEAEQGLPLDDFRLFVADASDVAEDGM